MICVIRLLSALFDLNRIHCLLRVVARFRFSAFIAFSLYASIIASLHVQPFPFFLVLCCLLSADCCRLTAVCGLPSADCRRLTSAISAFAYAEGYQLSQRVGRSPRGNCAPFSPHVPALATLGSFDNHGFRLNPQLIHYR